jgi:hypothetical protein
MNAGWSDAVLRTLGTVGERLLGVVPATLALIVLAGAGLLLAWVGAKFCQKLARAVDLDGRAETWGLGTSLRREGVSRPPSQLFGLVTFWGIFLLFATLAVDAMAVPGTERVTAFLFLWLPTALGALLILLIGWLLSHFLAQGVLIAAVNAGLPEARLVARGVRWGLLLFAVAMAITHLGLAKEIVLLAFGLTFGGLVLAAALAFGLGGRHLAREILERRLRREREPQSRETITHL